MDFAMRHKLKLAGLAAALAVALAFGLPAPIAGQKASAANACTQSCQVRFQQCMKGSGDRNACTDELNSCRNQCFAGG
jgi:hypothetical protein